MKSILGGVKAILLDGMGTLVELEPPAPRLREQLAQRFGAEVSDAEAKRAIAAEIAYYRSHLDEGRDPDSLADLRRRCAERVRQALPSAVQDALSDSDALTQALLASLRFRVYDDVAPAFGALKRRGARLVVVSNWDVSLSTVLDRLGIAGKLDGIVTSAGAGSRKPAAAIFELALRVAGVRAADAIHVGDSLEEDVVGARNAGVAPVWLRRDGFQDAGVPTISSLAELPGLVEIGDGYGVADG